MDALWKQINEAIHCRDQKLVHKLIPKYVRAHRASLEARYEASEFYRKISDYSNALRMLPKGRNRSSIGPKSNFSEIEIKLELQKARILTILGANKYAIRIVDRVRTENSSKSLIEMLEIYHCNNNYAAVIELIGEEYPLPDVEPWHQDWLLHFYLANALSGVRRTQPAIERMDKIHAISSSPLIHAIALCYKGKFLLQADLPEQALSSLLKSREFFRNDDQTGDHAILQMWLGRCFFKLKKFKEAEVALAKALAVFFQPAVAPEDWMEIALLLERLQDNQKEFLLAPRLSALFGPQCSLFVRQGLVQVANDGDFFSIKKSEPSRKARHIDRAADTVWQGEKAKLGLDLVDELICSLIYMGDYGLPQYRLYELFWPNELFAFDQHQKRLEQLVMRARAAGYEITWNGLHLYLRSEDVSASGYPDKIVRGASFLKERHGNGKVSFTRSDVEKYFKISRSSAAKLCREWLESELVSAQKDYTYSVQKI